MEVLWLYIQGGCITPVPKAWGLSYLINLAKFWFCSYIIASILLVPYSILIFFITYLLADYAFYRESLFFEVLSGDDDQED